MSNIDIQTASRSSQIPDELNIRRWCEAALLVENKQSEVVIRIVDADEIQTLNMEFRQKDKATNVLAFPSELPSHLQAELDMLGDIVICAGIVETEALAQNKSILAHWAHMVVHGTLHLQGFDHIDDHDAKIMEGRETELLVSMGFPAPYEFSTTINQ